MANMITFGSARFEIYEPNVCMCVILCAHAYLYEIDWEFVGGEVGLC